MLGAACTTTRNPVTGRPEVILMSEEQEKLIDQKASAQVEAQLGLVQDEAITAYVSAIGQMLAANSPRPDVTYEFSIIEMDEPNAFALPGGHIYVSRGLLLLANSEAELAAVLGHEIGHVAARHAAQRDAHVKTLGVATLLGTLASGSSAGAGRSGPIGPGGVAAYSRDQEREADRIGQNLVVEVGIDPIGMATFLRSLENTTRLTVGFSIRDTYFGTHPATAERIIEAETTGQLRRWEPGFAIAPTRADYLERIEGLAIGRPASEGVIDGPHFRHADLDFSVRFGLGWEIINQSSQVIALSPHNDALMVLEIQEPGIDPQAAAERYMKQENARFSTAAPLRIGDLDAFRARGSINTIAGPADAEVTWIAHNGNIFRLTAGALSRGFRRYAGIFRSFPRSFRPLRADELEQMSDLRLQIARAEEGETLAQLSERVGNEWELNRLGVVNRLSIDQTLPEGHLVKVAIRTPYRVKEAEATRPEPENAEDPVLGPAEPE